MPISESALHPYIKGLVEENGKLTVTELNKMLREILELDKTDLSILSGRNDDKFSQIVRNVVAHAPAGKSSRNGYIIDKTKRPAVFLAKELDMNKTVAANSTSTTQVSQLVISDRKNKRRSFTARKVDFDAMNTVRSSLGLAGELFALEWEKRRLNAAGVVFNISEEVIHFSQKYGDGAGYDILSRNENDYSPRYIEVKTTTKDWTTPFFMSVNERAFIETYKNSACIYRVYNFDQTTMLGNIKIINFDELTTDYIFDPVTYQVKRR